jgi:hypothetical protein
VLIRQALTVLAFPWHGRGHRFDPDQVHQQPYKIQQVIDYEQSLLSTLRVEILLPNALSNHIFKELDAMTSSRMWKGSLDLHREK